MLSTVHTHLFMYYEIFTYCAFTAFEMGLCSLPFYLLEFSILVFSLSMAEFSLIVSDLFSPRGGLVRSTYSFLYVLRDFYKLYFFSFYFIGIFPSGHFFIYGGIFPDLTCFVQPPRWAGAVHPHDGDSEPGAAHPGPGHRGLPLLLLQQRLWTGPTTALCLLRDEVGCCLLIF